MGLLRTNRAFARTWSAGLCFLLAWWALHAVMLIHVFDLTGSPFATGLIPVFSALPGILLGPIAGVLVDRWSRRDVMAWGALALVALLIVAIPLTASLGVSLLYAIIAIQSGIMTFYSPAENALLPTLVTTDNLRTANALNALNDALGRIVGPALGAWTLVEFGFVTTLIACAALYLGGWIFLVGLRDQRRAGSGPETVTGLRSLAGSVVASFREGLRYVAAKPALALVVAASAFGMVADVPNSAVLPAFMMDSVGISADLFGSLMSVRGVTGLLGGLLVVRLSRHVHESRLLAAGYLLQGLSYLAFGLGNNLFWSVFILFPVGPADAAIQTGLFTMLQKRAPDAVRGRVFALVGTINGLIVLTVSFAAGGLGEVYGTRAIVIAAGGLHLLPLLVAIIIMRRREVVP